MSTWGRRTDDEIDEDGAGADSQRERGDGGEGADPAQLADHGRGDEEGDREEDDVDEARRRRHLDELGFRLRGDVVRDVRQVTEREHGDAVACAARHGGLRRLRPDAVDGRRAVVDRDERRREREDLEDGVSDEDEVRDARRVLREPHAELDEVRAPRAVHVPAEVAVPDRLCEPLSQRLGLRRPEARRRRQLVHQEALASQQLLAAVVGERRDEEHAENARLKTRRVVTRNPPRDNPLNAQRTPSAKIRHHTLSSNNRDSWSVNERRI